MNRIKPVILLIFFLFFCFMLCADDKSESKTLYEQGQKKYEAGDIDGAISDLDKAIGLDERNFKAKKLLVDVLNDKGNQLIESGKFDEAFNVYEKAYRLWPDNADVREKYKGLKDGTIQEEYARQTEPEKSGKEEVIETLEEAEKELTRVIDSDKTKETSRTDESEVEKELREELARQQKLIEQMKMDYAKKEKTNDTSKQDVKMLEELLVMYKKMQEKEEESPEQNQDSLVLVLQEMKEYRMQLEKQRVELEKQQLTPLNLILIAGGSSLAGIILVVIVIFLFVRASSKRRRMNAQKAKQATNNYSGLGTPVNETNPLFLGYDGEQLEPELEEIAEVDDDEMYKDLLNYERLKKMHNQMKTGNLQWATVRENIDILHKELKTEILKLVEIKIEGGTSANYSAIFPVLFPFLTSGDDYLQKKSNVLAYKLLEQEKEKIRKQTKLLTVDKPESSINTRDSIDLSNTNLLIILAEQQNTKEGRPHHSLNVANYARRIGLVIGLDKDDLNLLFLAGLVHDFGYCLYDNDFLDKIKNNTDLSESEFIRIQQHPDLGVKYFEEKETELPDRVKNAIIYHHERNDGTGYPYGLKDDKIPEFAKIIAVADVFDALTSKRLYKEKLTVTSATIVMRDMGRRKFDIRYIDALIEFFKKV
ncbi:MAG: HD domain-containing protein [Spirochaetales bacterium]|nr:HD domain-containing protein [Spirochaetales bacterium]